MRIRVDGKPPKKLIKEAVLIDTNLWVYAITSQSSEFDKARAITLACMLGEIEGCVAPQNILEFYSVMTNPKAVTPLPNTKIITEICEDIWKSKTIRKIHPQKNTAFDAIVLSKNLGLRRAKVFDAFLASTARDNGVEIVWTDNVKDFQGFDFINASNPLTRKWELLKE
ncbi:PIN domain-containing protein [Candidatus Pacearchaeota archaeon]|nr:PIN domain-containing protein [Candidatus Pacearchaeota archaeon]